MVWGLYWGPLIQYFKRRRPSGKDRTALDVQGPDPSSHMLAEGFVGFAA